MKLKSALTMMVLGLVTCRFAAAADEQPPNPVPDPAVPGAAPAAAPPIALFACVKVEDCDNIAPCAETLIVSVADPCNPCCGCRYVEICVPKCGCPKIHTSKDGTRVSYDYGEYEVTVTSRRDYVKVNYDD